ncbi:MAG: InlB B-repeat-containing protein [Clostridia bacterium]|nr:InlB B-repeat-containing protein [Clostridia bacterium]
MNAKKILAILVLTFTMVAVLTCCDILFPAEEHEHVYSNWSIQTAPTEQASGAAIGKCECNETKEVTLPPLTDGEFWTKQVTPATHNSAGAEVYTSSYGSVEFELAIIPHEWTYTLTVNPTEASEGQARKTCECGATENVSVPALADTTVWSAEVTTEPTHTTEGEKTYTSELYGTVKVTLPKTEGHSYGAWTVITQATETAAGTAERECICGDKEQGVIPVLTDATVWTAEITKAPSHLEEGEKVYTSELYGTVKVTLAKTEGHAYGAWTVITQATETAAGTAERECACGAKEQGIIPVLTDATVWTATVATPATYNEAGVMTYSSIYGTVDVAIAKLVAPYDGKTYTNLVFDGELEESNKVVTAQDTWSNATLTLDANGFGFCTSYPYRGFTQIRMVDAETGRIDIVIYDIATDEDGNEVPNYESYITYPAYVDFATGIIVRARNSAFDYVVLYTPFEADPSYNSAVASSWNGNAMAFTYTVNDNAYSVFCTADRAYIGVSFSDMAGNAVSADACYNAAYVYVKNSAGELIASYGYDGEKQNALDGYEGTYSNSDNGDLVISGFGTLTLGGVSGSYTVADDGINVYLKDADGKVTHFYVVALGDDASYTLEMPKVNVSFVTGEYAEQEPIEYNKNVPQTLPTYTHPTMTFKGWYYDADCTQPVEADFIPTTDVTLYASWKAKVVITLVGTIGDDADTLYLGEGDVIGDFLPTYGLDLDNYKKFVAWYVDANGNGEIDGEDFALDLETTIGAEDTGATIIAQWIDLPAYYGTYYGVEIWNASYGNSSKTPITIDENGNISGFKTGIIVSYDPATQVVQWKTSATATSTYTFYFDAETGVIAGMYSNYDIGNDYYFYSRYTEATNGKVDAHYGVKAPKTPGSTEFNYYAQFITVDTKLGEDTTIFLYNNHIYNNVTITSAIGEVLTPSTVKDSKTVIVKDNKTGNIIVAVTSIGSSFSDNNNTMALDAYYGSYAMGDETIALDGTGTIIYGDKTGTYTATENGFDVYFAVDGVNTEYYVMTLDTAARTATLTKPMANVTLDANGKNVEFEQIGSVNINIAVALPTLSAEGFVFRGWYVQGDETMTAVGDSYTPTADVTLVALWKAEFVLNVVYNDNVTENGQFIYGEGEIATIDNPTYAKHKFDGWFTTADFAEGTEWASGSAMTESITIYAKWSDAPIYNLTYTVTEIERKNDSNATDLYKFYTRTAACFTIDPDGKSPKTSYPFATGDISITDYDPVAGTLVLNCGSKSYKGYIDKETGIILLNYVTGDADMQEFFFLNPLSTNSITSMMVGSYWNNGNTACIVYNFDDATSYTIFVNNNVVYFGVSFEDADGNAVAANACYQSSMLYVKDREGNLIAYFGYNGTTMCQLDGYEGTYTGENGDVVVSGYGALTIAGLNGTYTKIDDDTFGVYTFNEDNTVNMYYVVDIDKENKTYVAAPVPVTITFVSDHGAADPKSAFANVPTSLPTLSAEGFVFRGWYVQGDEAQTIVDINAFVTDGSVTLVAKWDAMLSVSVVYGNTLETVVDYYGAGDTPVLVEPGYTNGKAFDGWYTDADCTVAYVSGPISESITIYAKWVDAHPMFGSYKGANIYGSTQSGGSKTTSSGSSTFVVDALGNATFGNNTATITEYDPETCLFKAYTSDGKRFLGLFDAASGVLICNYSAGGEVIDDDVNIYVSGTSFGYNGCYWNSGMIKLGTIQGDAGAVNFFLFKDRIYSDVTWASDDGDVTALNAYQASNLYVYDSEGELIAYFAKDGSKGLVQKINDGMGGSYYTDGENNALVLNGYGAGTITNAAEGLENAALTYTVMGDDVAYDLEVVIGDAYYHVTISENTYSIVHVKYTVSFVTGIDGFIIDSVEVEHNAEYRLPSDVAYEGYKFEGWYTTADFSGSREYWYEENSDMTYYAKWSALYTVTMVYGEGMENVSSTYTSGSEVTFGAGLSSDGTGLYIWFADEACTQPITTAIITGDMTVYGVKAANVTYGTYNFVNKNGALVSNNKGIGSSTAAMTITMLGSYSVTYNYDVSTESGWDKFSVEETISGTSTTTVSGASGEDSGSKTATLAEGDSIYFAYKKDSSGNSGDDTVTLTLVIAPIA